jgi:hypothetical protein
MREAFLLLIPAGLAVLVSCGPVADPRSQKVDLLPPRVESVQSLGPDRVGVTFDEDAGLSDGKTRVDPALTIVEVTGPGRSIEIRGGEQTPGRMYTLEAEAQDARGNTASFMATFYGFNADVPQLLINELTPRGSGTHPDIVELKALTAGDMGGVALYVGTPGSYDARFVFPSFRIARGSFLLVHMKPSGDPAEVDEPGDPAVSRGEDASDTAYDFWVPDCKGLGANNGVLTLFTRPGGACLDGILYSNRSSQSDQAYRGFGSTDMLARAEELVQLGGWKPAGAHVLPEDAVSPEGSTGTRSLCRASTSEDTNSTRDWHVVPTRKATPGADNSDDVYVP